MTVALFYPLMDTLVYGLPHTYRRMDAEEGTVIQITVTTAIGGDWYLVKTADNWQLLKNNNRVVAAQIIIEPDLAWKIFSKGISPEAARDTVVIKGNEKLGEVALGMVSVMA